MNSRLLPSGFALLALAFCFAAGFAAAHQPRIVNSSAGGAVIVSNQEVSQAFYGEFKDAPTAFVVNSSEDFVLSVQVLVPDSPPTPKDVSATVLKIADYRGAPVRETVAVLDAASANWSGYYEEYAGDYYYAGGSFRGQVKAGVYEIVASRPGNEGKFVLVVGWKEEFSAGDWLNALLLLPTLKRDFFNKPFYASFSNLVGLYLFFVLLIAAGLLLLLSSGMRKKNLHYPEPK